MRKNTPPRQAGLLYGSDLHYLDHLAPLCALRKVPLIVTEKKLDHLSRKFYPDLQRIYWNPEQAPEKLVSFFEEIITCMPRPIFDQLALLPQILYNKRVKTIWCPHGNSDKGRKSPFMEGLADEELLLTYGPQMEAHLLEKGVTAKMERVGNYRFDYYEKHRPFYENILPKKEKPLILYAPTWQDREKNSSFPYLLETLIDPPKEFDLKIKLHPHLYTQFPQEIRTLKAKGAHLIEDCPTIYPLLSKTDLLISDKSSICYDFLPFQRPMVLLQPSHLAQVTHYLPLNQREHLFSFCQEKINSPCDYRQVLREAFEAP